jgi:hypothetical protein
MGLLGVCQPLHALASRNNNNHLCGLSEDGSIASWSSESDEGDCDSFATVWH